MDGDQKWRQSCESIAQHAIEDYNGFRDFAQCFYVWL